MIELTTVADDAAVFHDGDSTHRLADLPPGCAGEFAGVEYRTLPRPGGDLLARFATVNDLHFGETECGRIDDHTDGPILSVPDGTTPYPTLMNHAAVEEIVAAGIDTVFVKGDVTTDGTAAEWAGFEACYGGFGEGLHVVRGNHDAYRGQSRYEGDTWVDLPGLTVGLLDTVIPAASTGNLSSEQLDAADDRIAAADGPVLLLGHHQQWVGQSDGGRDAGYFGIHPDASDALDELCVRHRNIVGYAAGHTHRHRVRRMRRSGAPSIEVGCVKDFPGTWAEYRVFEGGVMQVVHRISSPDALAWSERCRGLYADFGVDYGAYAAGRLDDRCFVFPARA